MRVKSTETPESGAVWPATAKLITSGVPKTGGVPPGLSGIAPTPVPAMVTGGHDGVAVGVAVAVAVAVAVGVVVAVGVGDAVAVGVAVPPGVAVGVAVPPGVAVGVGVAVAFGVAVGVGVGARVKRTTCGS